MRGDVGRGHWELAAPHVASETLTPRRVTVGIVRRFEGLTEGPLRPYLHGGIGAYGYSFDVASQESTTRMGVHGGFGMEFLFKDNRMAVTSEVAVRGVRGSAGPVVAYTLFTGSFELGVKARF